MTSVLFAEGVGKPEVAWEDVLFAEAVGKPEVPWDDVLFVEAVGKPGVPWEDAWPVPEGAKVVLVDDLDNVLDAEEVV